jgi:serine phosphatase RsbU (regulator of sigma subunit)
VVHKAIAGLARRLWSDFDQLSERECGWHLVELASIAISLPLVLISSVSLAMATDLELFQRQWPVFLLLLLMGFLLSLISFFQIVGRQAGSYSYNSSDLENIVTATGILILGPTAVWVHFFSRLFYFLTRFPRLGDRVTRLNWFRNLLFNLWTGNLSLLAAALVYDAAGGVVPPQGLTLNSFGAGLLALLAEFLLSAFFIWALLRLHVTFLPAGEGRLAAARLGETMRFFVVAGAPTLFALLAAPIYGQMGAMALLFFFLGAVGVSLLARSLSQAAVMSQQQRRQFAQLEALGREIIASAPDASTLPSLLADFMPGTFDYDQAEVRLFSGEVLFRSMPKAGEIDERVWEWSKNHPESVVRQVGEPLPWAENRAQRNLLLVPILESETGDKTALPLGAILLASRALSRTMTFRASMTALQVLAAQISSTLQRAEAHARELAFERVAQELAFARQIQESFLPADVPQRAGWEIAAMLQPARTTSGDFYDVFELDGEKLGLLIADVADKGLGAAMFMAFSRTLLRTYAASNPDRPHAVFRAVNERILADAHNDMFVTVFYAVLDTRNGCLTYANAGHDPPLLVGSEEAPRLLPNTGIPLGIDEEARWTTEEAALAAGETLLLYTDGVTEAHRADYEMFGAERLRRLARQQHGTAAAELQQVILHEVQRFTGGHPQADDITTLVLRRTAANGQLPNAG